MRWLADHGFLTLSVDYGASAADDIRCALGWVNEHAQDYGGDRERLFTYGRGLGGASIMNVSYDAAAHHPSTECGEVAVPLAVYIDSPDIDPLVKAEEALHITDKAQPTYVVRGEFDRVVPPHNYIDYRAAMREHGRELEEVVRPRSDYPSAQTYNGVWNQLVQFSLVDFFERNGAFGEPVNPMLRHAV